MNDFDFYRKNNKTLYKPDETITDTTPSKLILLKCIECQTTYTLAYKCRDNDCPLYEFKRTHMKRPHTCPASFLKVRKNPNFLAKKS